MQLPESFLSTIRNVFKEKGEKFLADLPASIDEVSQRWNLTDIQPVPNLSFNFVAYAKRVSIRPTSAGCPTAGQEDVILKMGVPHRELTSEIEALRFFNGEGACRLLEHDEERGFLLLERLKPGKMLSELEDDDECTRIAADVMIRLWRDIPNPAAGDGGSSNDKFIKLSDWFDGLKRIRPHFNGGTGPFPRKILERVEALLPELFADEDVKLLHGDFHHYNILSSERGWLVIDPKGVIGPAGYEIGPFMINPWYDISDWMNFRVKVKRRISILSERLNWSRETIIHWSLAHALLSAWWNIEDGMEDEHSLHCAEIFAELDAA
jgi:streptomycin 6-kinase